VTNLVRDTNYDVVVSYQANITAADGKETTELFSVRHKIRRFDMLWLWGIAASAFSSLGSTIGLLCVAPGGKGIHAPPCAFHPRFPTVKHTGARGHHLTAGG
jgi:hypothetical protein